jgi:hypothetical protein
MRTVLITGARTPIALDLAHSFKAAGFDAHLADCVQPWAARLSRFGGNRLHRFAPPRHRFAQFTADLATLIARIRPEMIIPTCEEVFYLAAAMQALGLSGLLFAPPLDVLRKLHSKVEFAGLAARCGIPGPVTRRVTSVEGLTAWRAQAGNLVFKPEFSRFATDTLIRPSAAALAQVTPTPQTPWAVQDFVAGDEICLWSAARAGEIVAFAAYQPRWRLGRSSSFFFDPDSDPALLEFCRKIARGANVTGQLSFDVIRDGGGVIRPLECNPRGISGIHLFAAAPAMAWALAGESGLAVAPMAPRHLAPAMWLLGAPQALARGQWRAFRADMRRGSDALNLPGETWSRTGTLLDAARFFYAGLKNGRSAAGQSTDDIEWNGEEIQ